MVYVSCTINGKIDSRELWDDLNSYDVNVTDLGEVTYVYGQVSMYDSLFVIDICRKYGDTISEVTSI